ncbi:MAG TPA: C45 family autoproteolytic acyltransferase/hydrolase [Verrucomicrobiales bacterium]|nr:C45 family autoproteolytic acyltransferase/hydrolase [Verrucomicrobiales bacterium]
MKSLFVSLLPMTVLASTVALRAEDAAPAAKVVGCLQQAVAFISPEQGTKARTLDLDLSFENATGGIKFLNGRPLRIKFQAPNRFWLSTEINGPVSLSSDGTKVWIHVPKKNMLLEGDAAVPRFSTRSDSVKETKVPDAKLPVTAAQVALLPALADITSTAIAGGGTTISLTPKDAAVQSLKIPKATLTAVLPDQSGWPQTISYDDGKGNAATLRIKSHAVSDQLPDTTWRPAAEADDKTERVALAHLVKFLETAVGSIGSRIPTLPPATGARRIVATEGKGRLEDHDGTRVLFLEGTPEEMGHQHGVLLKKEIRRALNRILYGVGVGSSFDKGRWFFGEIEEAVRRTGPFIDPRHLREMDAIADAVGMDHEEVRLANFFPELFHCSGFALMGDATVDGKLYHGRILDYLRGAGLEENAVVMIMKPDKGNAWVNVSYAGFIGSVTAMNEKQVAIGEMGGRGEGHWDGKPMAQLVREVMEKASTLEEAIEIMRKGPRTCEYYYVLSDAKSRRACGLKTTPDIFEIVWPGEKHPQLSDPVKDTVLLSAGDRYKELVRRVNANYGKFTADSARELMTRPVCMNSNIHSVLFAPDSLDFWVANADSENVASATRYTRYNLRELLQGPAAVKNQ